jgi:CIC family chloride channel protein
VVVPALVATVIAAEITRLIVGQGPIYGHRSFALHSALELFLFAGLGLLGALAAQGFMRLLSWGEHVFQRFSLALPWRPLVGGLLAGSMIAFLPEVAGNGYEPLNAVIDARFPLTFVLILLFVKCFATTASVSSGSPGGVFTPTLLLGGGVGYAYGALLAALFGDAVGPAGGYALVGMAATTAASTHAPLMAAVMAFELSGDYAVVLPLSLATAVATGVSRALRKDSVYTAELRARGVGWELTLEGRRMAQRK